MNLLSVDLYHKHMKGVYADDFADECASVNVKVVLLVGIPVKFHGVVADNHRM